MVDQHPYFLKYTKLNRPVIASEHLHRQRLLGRLEKRRQRPLTLVSAPAGYGKSMLISRWLESCDSSSAWLSLDADDNDLRQFVSYFIEAVHTLFPGACQRSQSLLGGPDLPPLGVLSSSLLNELNRIEQPYVIVLDDYHFLSSTEINGLLEEILMHPPSTMHLVIIGRKDPSLPIYSLRAQGLVTEIRMMDLRFNEFETAELLKLITGVRIDSKIAATLREKTEGWVTGLCLAALSLRLKDTQEITSLESLVSADYVMEYFFSEVFAKQPPQISQYLLGCSILDRFCAPLCEAVYVSATEGFSSEIGGWEYLNWLKKENLFLIPLDSQNRWFRFHHLFQELLLRQLERGFRVRDINALHSRASAWFAENGMTEEAIRHAVAAGDPNGAAQLVVQNRQAAINDERWFELEKWLSMLPNETVELQPELLLAQVWIHYYNYDYRLIPAVLERIESLLSNRPDQHVLSGEINLFKGLFNVFQGDSERALKYIEEALGQIPEAQEYARAGAEQYWGVAAQMQGQKKRIVAELTDLLQSQPLKDLRKVRVMAALVTMHILSGDLAAALNQGENLKRFAIKINSNHYIAWGSYFLGLIHFCRNELDKAIDYLSRAADLGHMILRRAFVDSLGGLALAYQAKQETDNAARSFERLDGYVRSLENPEFMDIVHSLAARLKLMKENGPVASGLGNITPQSTAGPMFFWLEHPDITQCRTLIVVGSDSDLREAENKLKACLRSSQAQHNSFQTIFIMPLLAAVYEKQGRSEEALTVLEEAVSLAVPGGFIWPFVDSGPNMISLLKQLDEQNIAAPFIGKVLDAVSPPAHKPQSMAQMTNGLLTNREIDILLQLAERLRTKEMSEKLFISTHTVNAHLKSLYRKLDVHNRVEAVARAKNLGII